MAEVDGGGETVIVIKVSDVIKSFIKEVNNLVDEANSLVGNNSMSSYCYSTCTKLSHEHPNGDVKGCKWKHLTSEEYITDLRAQRDRLTDHVLLLRNNAQAAVDKIKYDDLLQVQKVEINGLLD